MATGTIADPFTFAEALASAAVGPGDTLLLRDGTYAGDFTSTLIGSRAAPIQIRNYPGERPVINGKLTINGRWTTWAGLEITKSGWTRQSAEEGSAPTDIVDSKLIIAGQGSSFIGNVIHDISEVIAGTTAYESIFADNVVYYIGWNGAEGDRGHGHGIYAANFVAERLIVGNVFHSVFGWGIHIYTDGGSIDYFTLDDNTCFNAGILSDPPVSRDAILLGGLATAIQPTLRRNMCYGSGMNVGYREYTGATNVTLDDNYCPSGIVTTACTFLSNAGNYAGPAVGNVAFARASRYTTGRGTVTVFNEANADSVVVDVTAVLAAGAAYTLRNAQDYYTDVVTGTVAGNGTITIDMRAISHSVAAPVGWTAPATTCPTFGSFVLEAT